MSRLCAAWSMGQRAEQYHNMSLLRQWPANDAWFMLSDNRPVLTRRPCQLKSRVSL